MIGVTLPWLMLPLLASAHFKLEYPPQRDADEEQQGTYPCSGANAPSEERIELPLNAPFPIQLDLEHTTSKIQVLLAIGNSPSGDNFTYTLRPTIQERGPQDFCLGGVRLPTDWNIKAGTNATIQVVTDSHEGGQGLYNCADVTFVDTPLSQEQYNSHCSNSSGISVASTSNLGNANGSTPVIGSNTQGGSQTSDAAPGATSSGAASALSAGEYAFTSLRWSGIAALLAVAGGTGLLL